MWDFPPMTAQQLDKMGWSQPDFLYIIGDAYVDHPSFGPAIITRLLNSKKYKIGIIAQPDWRTNDDFLKLGTPRLGVLVSSGNIDSMVNHYTAAKKARSSDAYSPGGVKGKRPDRAVIVYCNKVREIFGNIPIIIGGLEASLRRFAHYDYWDDKVRKSIIIDSGADLLIYGMGEKPILEIAERLNSGCDVHDIIDIRGTVYKTKMAAIKGSITVPSYGQVVSDKKKYAVSCKMQFDEQDHITGRTVLQQHDRMFVVQNPPAVPLTRSELDSVYALPFMRTCHPIYEQVGVPALEEVEFSITSSRGCFGACNFCALAFHQGRVVQSRSHASILREAENMTWSENFKGYIHDVGGPTANFRNPACDKQLSKGVCRGKQCLFPRRCENMIISHKEYAQLLKKLTEIQNVKKVFVRSGIRFDYLIHDKDDEFFWQLCEHHISGQLKTAPEHVSDKVLRLMGKPSHDVYERFVKKFRDVNGYLNKKQYIVPYFMSGHPGSTLRDAIRLAEYLRDIKYTPEQVQDFYPTPGTISTCMFYTGINPITMDEVYVPRSAKEKAMQRALLQYRNPANYKLVYEALTKANRSDLIGYGPKCLIRPQLKQSGDMLKGKKKK